MESGRASNAVYRLNQSVRCIWRSRRGNAGILDSEYTLSPGLTGGCYTFSRNCEIATAPGGVTTARKIVPPYLYGVALDFESGVARRLSTHLRGRTHYSLNDLYFQKELRSDRKVHAPIMNGL